MSTTRAYAVVYEDEGDGGVSAYVPDLAVFVSAPSMSQAKKDIRKGIEIYLREMTQMQVPLPAVHSRAEYVSVRVGTPVKTLRFTNAAASSLGKRTSVRKAAAARANGRKGGRPLKRTSAKG